MFIANDKNGNRTYIKDAVKGEEYFCPVCGSKVILRQGEKKVWHYAHKSLSEDCDNGGMTYWHSYWQSLFPKEETEIVTKYTPSHCFMTECFGLTEGKEYKKRADVIHNNYVIEFQHSQMSTEEFVFRGYTYWNNEFPIIWIFDMRDLLSKMPVFKKKNEKIIRIWNRPKKLFSDFIKEQKDNFVEKDKINKNTRVFFHFEKDGTHWIEELIATECIGRIIVTSKEKGYELMDELGMDKVENLFQNYNEPISEKIRRIE